MKRNLAILMSVIMVMSCILLTACGSKGGSDLSDSKYVGTWKFTKVALKDESEEFTDDYTLILKGDGTGQFISEESTSNVTWELTKDGFKTKGDTKLTFTDDGDNIKAKLFGVDMIFERQP